MVYTSLFFLFLLFFDFFGTYNLHSKTVAHLSLGSARTTRDSGVIPGTCVMLGEVTQVDLVLGMGPWAIRTPPTPTN
jgi:hypothetical protein